MIIIVKIIIIYLLAVTLLPSSFSVNAQPVDLRIVVDISDDVRKAVPGKQHLDVINLLVNQLPAGSKAGIWTYGKYVNHLVQYDNISPAWLSEAGDSTSKIRSVATRRDIFSALKKSAFDLDKNSSLPRHILLMSSGDIDVSDGAGNTRSRDLLLNSLLPEIMSTGIKVHTLSLSEDNGTGLLRTLSRETSGYSFVARNPESIIYFGNTLAGIFKPDNYIPIHGNQFAIDASVTGFTATLFGVSPSSLGLIAPDGKTYSYDTDRNGWLAGKHYARFQMDDPEPGHWKITGGVLPESRVYLRSSQTLEIDGLKTAYVTSENILVSAITRESDPGAGKRGFSQEARFDITIDSIDDATSSLGSRKSFLQAMSASAIEEGAYQAEVLGLSQEGLYRLRTVVKTIDYERGMDRLIQVNELFKMDVSALSIDEKMSYIIQIMPTNEDLILNKTTVIATITDSAGKWNIRTIDFIEAKGWQLTLDDDNQSAEFKVELDFKGHTFSGREVHYRPKPLIIELSSNSENSAVSRSSEDKTVSNIKVEKSESITGLFPDNNLVSSDKDKSPEPLSPGNHSRKPDSNAWILILGIGFVFGSVIVFFYFWRLNKQPVNKMDKSQESTRKEAVATKPAAENVRDEPLVVKEVVKEGVIDTETLTRTLLNTDQPVESVDTKSLAEKSIRPEVGLGLDQVNGEDFEIDIDFDSVLSEETELASEWRNLDAKSNVSTEAESDLHIELEVEDTDKDKSGKKA